MSGYLRDDFLAFFMGFFLPAHPHLPAIGNLLVWRPRQEPACGARRTFGRFPETTIASLRGASDRDIPSRPDVLLVQTAAVGETLTTLAARGPLGPWVMSNVTLSPSVRDL